MNYSLMSLIATIISDKIISSFRLSYTMYGVIYSSINEVILIINKFILGLNIDINYLFQQENIKKLLINFNTFKVYRIYLFCFLFITGSLLLIFYFYDKLYNKFLELRIFFDKIDHCSLKIYEIDTINNISDYIIENPSYFDNFKSGEKGDESLIGTIMKNDLNTKGYGNSGRFNNNLLTLCSMIVPSEGNKIIINDVRNNIKGFLVFNKTEIEICDYTDSSTKNNSENNSNDNFQRKNNSEEKLREFNFNHPYLEICLKVDNIGKVNNYVENINYYIEEVKKDKLYAYFFNKTGKHFYKEIAKRSEIIFEDNEKTYIDTFFHPLKNELWNTIKKIHYEPSFFNSRGQPATSNLLLYGPPGTGKSSFAYRIAKALGREIITLDLRDFKLKEDVMNLFDDPSDIFYDQTTTSKNSVYILDEFDIYVKYLYSKQKEKNKKDNKLLKYFNILINKKYNTKNNGININNNSKDENNEDNKNNENLKNNSSDFNKNHQNNPNALNYYGIQQHNNIMGPIYPNIFNNDLLTDSDNEDDVESDNSSDNNSDDNSKTKNKEKKNNKEENIKKDKKDKKDKKKKNLFKEYEKSDEFCLKDLLTVLQGPVPTEGRIIIATTNDYEGIKEICPELVRSGRMTPVLFDYVDKKIFEEICLYYFNQTSDIEIKNKIKIPTSEIMEICLNCQVNNLSFEYFIEKIKSISK